MSDEWKIRLPYRGPDDSIADAVAAAAEEMEGVEKSVTEALLFAALGRGVTKTADLIAQLKAAGQPGRRRLLNEARAAIGLPPIEQVEAKRSLEARTLSSLVAANSYTSRLVLSESGAIRDAAADDRESQREAAELESRRRLREADQRARIESQAASEAEQRARREQLRRELPEGIEP